MCKSKLPQIFLHAKRQAFTLIEIVVALAIVSVALVPLVGLHLKNLHMAAEAEAIYEAVFLAQEMVAEKVSSQYSKEPTGTGSTLRNTDRLVGRLRAEKGCPPTMERAQSDIEKISLRITAKQVEYRTPYLDASLYITNRISK